MKRLAGLLVFVLLLAVSINSYAGDEKKSEASAGALKFGYVDFNRALNETEEGKGAKATLQAEFNEMQKKLDIIQNDLQKMKEKIDKDRLIQSADVQQKKEEEYRNKFMELQQKLAQSKQEMGQRETTLTLNVLNKLKDIVKDIGAKENYTMILEKSQHVVLSAPAIDDLTDRVIQICNKTKPKK